jgi:uncharacterized protein (TIGR03437 family)
MRSLALSITLGVAFSAMICLAQTPAPVTVINYAGYTSTFPVAPGSIASAYGNFGSIATTALTNLNPMPKELAGVKLRVNNVDAPLYFVSSSQINFVVPVATAIGKQAVEVLSGGSVVASGSVNVYDVGPGLASSDNSATRQGIIQNQDYGVNSQTVRARRGEIIQIYATGCGATNPAVTDGVPPSAAAHAVAPVKAYLSVSEAVVHYAGAHPQFPGICQVNVAVPNEAFITGQVPVFITVNGIASNPVSVWIQ